MTRRRATLFVVALWAVGVAGGLAARPAWPIDETRYLAVAWEMYTGGDLLVPHLNGNPYSDKPPLLFWLVNAGWRLFGVSEWWARLVPCLFALGSLLLTARLARRLWPDREDVARREDEDRQLRPAARPGRHGGHADGRLRAQVPQHRRLSADALTAA